MILNTQYSRKLPKDFRRFGMFKKLFGEYSGKYIEWNDNYINYRYKLFHNDYYHSPRYYDLVKKFFPEFTEEYELLQQGINPKTKRKINKKKKTWEDANWKLKYKIEKTIDKKNNYKFLGKLKVSNYLYLYSLTDAGKKWLEKESIRFKELQNLNKLYHLKSLNEYIEFEGIKYTLPEEIKTTYDGRVMPKYLKCFHAYIHINCGGKISRTPSTQIIKNTLRHGRECKSCRDWYGCAKGCPPEGSEYTVTIKETKTICKCSKCKNLWYSNTNTVRLYE